ncbi:DUF2971 domain-containing protein [Enterovibrio coralii]|nr:DUF2971 domain-containing protein [Enterovibrio coralii]
MEVLWTYRAVEGIVKKYRQSVDCPRTSFAFENLLSSLNANHQHAYIASFSADSDLLSQWRGYADDGFGVSIGFEIEYDRLDQLPNVGLYPVDYDLSTLLNLVTEQCEKIVSLYGNSPSLDDIHRVMTKVIYEIVSSSFVCKNPAFIEEKEARLVHTPTVDSIKFEDALSDIKYRVVCGSIASYFTFGFFPNEVKSITLGPKCRCNKEELKLFLRQSGYPHVLINDSSSSYR